VLGGEQRAQDAQDGAFGESEVMHGPRMVRSRGLERFQADWK
jgi:hypothetical protein